MERGAPPRRLFCYVVGTIRTCGDGAASGGGWPGEDRAKSGVRQIPWRGSVGLDRRGSPRCAPRREQRGRQVRVGGDAQHVAERAQHPSGSWRRRQERGKLRIGQQEPDLPGHLGGLRCEADQPGEALRQAGFRDACRSFRGVWPGRRCARLADCVAHRVDTLRAVGQRREPGGEAVEIGPYQKNNRRGGMVASRVGGDDVPQHRENLAKATGEASRRVVTDEGGDGVHVRSKDTSRNFCQGGAVDEPREVMRFAAEARCPLAGNSVPTRPRPWRGMFR